MTIQVTKQSDGTYSVEGFTEGDLKALEASLQLAELYTDELQPGAKPSGTWLELKKALAPYKDV